jgi:hypothetical protein
MNPEQVHRPDAEHSTARPSAPVGGGQQDAFQHLQQSYGNQAVRQLLSAAPDADDLGQRIRSGAAGGRGLDPDVQRRLESGLKADLSAVRVHTDTSADRLAREVDAVAFTTGSDIFFQSGAYNPESSSGLHMLAHEATHTLQQARGPVSGIPTESGVSISHPSDPFEQAAEHAADAAVSSSS